jgi:hypothetical protein
MQFKGGKVMNMKGQASIYSFFTMIIGLIMLVAFLPVVNELVFHANASNMQALSFVDVIQLLLGMSGLLMVLLFFMWVISDFQTRQTYVQ